MCADKLKLKLFFCLFSSADLICWIHAFYRLYNCQSERYIHKCTLCNLHCQTEATFSTSGCLLFNMSCEKQLKREGLHPPCDLCRNEFGVHRPRKNLLSDCWCSCLYMNPLLLHTHTQQCQRKSTYNRRERLLSFSFLSLSLFISLRPFFKVL